MKKRVSARSPGRAASRTAASRPAVRDVSPSPSSDPLRPLVLFILALAALAYLGGIVWAGVATLVDPSREPELPAIVTYAITAVGGLLATHFGAVFGISQLSGGAPQALHRFWKWVSLPVRAEGVTTTLDWMQIAAAYLYVGSLLLAVVLWAVDGLSPLASRALINMTFTLVGVFAGIGAVALNVKK